MPVQPSANPEWTARLQQTSAPIPRQGVAAMPEVGRQLWGAWDTDAPSTRNALPEWYTDARPQHMLAAALAAASVNGLLSAACYAFPGMAIPTVGMRVAMTLGATAFGWGAVDCPLAALGAVVGATAGVGVAVMAGLTSLPVVIMIMALTTWVGGTLGYALSQRKDAAPRPDAPVGARHAPDRGDASAGGSGRLRLSTALTLEGPHRQDAFDELSRFEPASAAWRQRLRHKLDALDHPYASAYRAKGLHQLEICEGPQTTENKLGTYSWLKHFDRLVDTLRPVQPALAEDTAQFDAELSRQLDGIWGNDAVKNKIRQCVAVQQEGTGAMGVICLMGESGSGKNKIANAVKSAYGHSREVALDSLPLEAFVGFAKTHTDSEPSRVAALLCARPGSFCVLHIDEVNKACVQKQQALLSLLAPENQFVDEYFDLPIDKSRLLVICTMMSENGKMGAIEPDLWNRLKQHAVVTSKVTAQGALEIAERALVRDMAQARFEAVDPQQRRAIAMEICEARPNHEPGRYIEGSVSEVLAQAILMRRQTRVAPAISVDLVSQILNRTWARRQSIEIVEPKTYFLPSKTTRYDVLTLFAVMNDELTRCRWNVGAGDGQRIIFHLADTDNRSLRLCHIDGSRDSRHFVIDMSLLPRVQIEPNDIVSQDCLANRSAWPRPSRIGVCTYSVPNGASLSVLRRWGCRLNEHQSLMALPVVLNKVSLWSETSAAA